MTPSQIIQDRARDLYNADYVDAPDFADAELALQNAYLLKAMLEHLDIEDRKDES